MINRRFHDIELWLQLLQRYLSLALPSQPETSNPTRHASDISGGPLYDPDHHFNEHRMKGSRTRCEVRERSIRPQSRNITKGTAVRHTSEQIRSSSIDQFSIAYSTSRSSTALSRSSPIVDHVPSIELD